MRYRRFGHTGLFVSELTLGTMTFGGGSGWWTAIGALQQAAVEELIGRALDAGVNMLDTANVYSEGESETLVGAALKTLNRPRDQVMVATKVRARMGPGPNQIGLSRNHIMAAIDASLRRLGTDYVDLYQVHAPDPDTPIDETLGALDSIIQSGKARYIGCSNFQAWQLANALWTSDRLGLARFDSVQPRYNLLFREIEHELFPLCEDKGVGVIVYNPLAGGFLTGKHRRGAPPADNTRFAVAGKLYLDRYWNEASFEAVERIRNFFEARKKSLTHVALAWVLKQRAVTSAIVGATSAEQLRDALGYVDLELDRDELDRCDGVWYEVPRSRDPRIALR